MHDQDYTVAQLKAFWPDGYWETFSEGSYTPQSYTSVCELITPYFNKGHTALELGPGLGRWTDLLVKNFGMVIALDVMPMPKRLVSAAHTNLVYWLLNDRDFYCTPVCDDAVEFVFSFGMFCHLSPQACATYLKSVYRVLKPGGKLVAMFANWERHPSLDSKAIEYMLKPGPICWFYNNWRLVNSLAVDAGFVNCRDALPCFRDTMLYAEKPI